MAPTMEQLGRRVADWRARLLGKGLKVNAENSKSDGWKQRWEDGCKLWKVVSVGKEYRSTGKLFQCTVCKKWIHKWCSGVRACRRCDGKIQEVDLAVDLMVDGETYECVRELLLSGRHS